MMLSSIIMLTINYGLDSKMLPITRSPTGAVHNLPGPMTPI
jgi:hypothetical protein